MNDPRIAVPVFLMPVLYERPKKAPITPPAAAAPRVIFWFCTYANLRIVRASTIPSPKERMATPHSLESFHAATPARIPKADATTISTIKCHIYALSTERKLMPTRVKTRVTTRKARKPMTRGKNLEPRKHMSRPTPIRMMPVNGATAAWYFPIG